MNSFVDTLKQLGPARLGIMGAVLLGLLMFFVFVSMRVSQPDLKLLYSELSTTDASSMAATLEGAGVPYQVSDDGTRILVPDDDVGRARMLLAEAGLPNGGSLGYELFDQQSGFGTTTLVQNVNKVRALEGELSRTISSMDTVRSARVHLVLPERELFSRQTQPASASVVIGLTPGARLERDQVIAIQFLVASAVPQLKSTDVSIIDSDGNLLARGGEDENSLMTVKAEEFRLNYEQRLMSAIEEMVGRVVGFGNVQAMVTADLNFDRISTNEELFDPETQVVRSTQVTEENNLEREPPPEGVNVDQNLPGIGGELLLDARPTLENNRVEEVTNFEISRTVRSMVREVGEVRKLSVAVLVDGRYTTDENGERVYEPRSEEEIEQIETLVQTAVGYDAGRGDSIRVTNMAFAAVDSGEDIVEADRLFGFEKDDLLDVAEILVVAVMIIVVVLMVLQPMVGRLLESQEMPEEQADPAFNLLGAASDKTPALMSPEQAGEFEPKEGDGSMSDEDMINMQQVEGKVKASSIKKVEDIVSAYPSETVSVIRSWMTQDG